MLYIFTKSTRNAGGSRHRAFLVADFLKKEGYESKLIVPAVYNKDVSRFKARLIYLKTIFSLRKKDVVFLQNPIFSTYFIIAIIIVKIVFRPTIIFDFDDATWVQNSIAPKVLAMFSDKFIVASHHLAKWSWIRSKPVMVMSNLVDYSLAEKYKVVKDSDKVVIGWIGGAEKSIKNLELLVPVLQKLADKKLPIIFKIVGAGHSGKVQDMFDATGVETEYVETLDWGKEGEIQKVNNSFDIGVCPLLDNDSNKARCSLKVLDYMASGVPVVISPVGENKYFIEGEVGGFLPKNEDEWVEDLERLILDNELRERKGREAKERLIKNYSYQGNMGKYIDYLGLNSK
jgi:glycosyltransferase involved in cell wall biosynthesis